MFEVLMIDGYFSHELLATLVGPTIRVRPGTAEGDGRDAVGLVTSHAPVGAEQLRHMPNLKVVVTASVGFEHLDLRALKSAGIIVCNAPAYCSDEVADHALASVLSLLRGLPGFDRATHRQQWDLTAGQPLRRIAGTKLGIIGLGRTGSRLAQRGRALGMDIIGYHPSRSPAEVFALGARPATLEELLAESDAVSLHAPGGLPGGALLKANELARMRPDAVLVNVARASLVDLDALATALNTGKLRAAYLDVWEKEPPDWRDQRLCARNLFLSPHAGWASTDSEQKLFVSVADSLCATLAGHEPNNRLV